jgi:ABC-type dipeptide/oligopeptide/nickel transport system permease component
MGRFFVRRLGQSLLTLFGASLLLFAILFVITDPFATFGERQRAPADKAQL